MKRANLLLAAALLCCGPPASGKGDDNVIVINADPNAQPGCTSIGGEYQTTEVSDGSDCGWEQDEASYVMRITQTSCNVDIELSDGHHLTGVVGDGEVTVNGTIEEDGGMFTATDAVLSADGQTVEGTLSLDVTSNDQSLMCTFVVTLTATRIGEPTNNQATNAMTALTLDQVVVGAWGVGGSCDSNEVEVGLFICPGGRIRGVKRFNQFDFLVCGTWSATPPDRVSSEERWIAVADPNDPANNDINENAYVYDRAADTLTWNGACAFPMQRLEGGVSADDCESSACSAGGSGPVQCGTDCDCGRCNYCESGECRYGGEGPFGCYRGCGL